MWGYFKVEAVDDLDQLRPMFQFLAQNGTELIIEAEDMDKYSSFLRQNRFQKTGINGLERLASRITLFSTTT